MKEIHTSSNFRNGLFELSSACLVSVEIATEGIGHLQRTNFVVGGAELLDLVSVTLSGTHNQIGLLDEVVCDQL